ncbi:unnamed protein product [Fusarium venenatum]|uniref:Uncharacterized protein n=1 Tax=Fusarium venenatum TaxID=56646 RepID=A0A2L2TZM4_9HYPO|nr:uncharacterized protein FVRRES_03237 [Fusarium venenatum]CEI66725.1 unnamed protein product [Fusarium venenatum]
MPKRGDLEEEEKKKNGAAHAGKRRRSSRSKGRTRGDNESSKTGAELRSDPVWPGVAEPKYLVLTLFQQVTTRGGNTKAGLG